MVISGYKRFLYSLFWCFASQLLIVPVAGNDLPAMIKVFSADDSSLEDWQQKVFAGRTRYTLLRHNGKSLIHADSEGAASGLYRKLSIDLQEHPYLNWRWRIHGRLENLDETKKSGDDYAARIYVIARDGLLFWKTRAICYVWASEMRKGAVWNNAYAGEAVKMVAVRSSEDALSTWYSERRNVRRDFSRLFGDNTAKIVSVAVMVDTDNSHQAVTTDYSDISFSGR